MPPVSLSPTTSALLLHESTTPRIVLKPTMPPTCLFPFILPSKLQFITRPSLYPTMPPAAFAVSSRSSYVIFIFSRSCAARRRKIFSVVSPFSSLTFIVPETFRSRTCASLDSDENKPLFEPSNSRFTFFILCPPPSKTPQKTSAFLISTPARSMSFSSTNFLFFEYSS